MFLMSPDSHLVELCGDDELGPSFSSSSTAKTAPRQQKRKKEDAGTGKETFKTRQVTATTNVAIGTTLRVKILEEGGPVVYSAVVVE